MLSTWRGEWAEITTNTGGQHETYCQIPGALMEDFHYSQPISSVRHVAFPFPKSWRDSPELTRIREAFNWMVDFGLFTLYETKFADGRAH